jgi:hypothetical protein
MTSRVSTDMRRVHCNALGEFGKREGQGEEDKEIGVYDFGFWIQGLHSCARWQGEGEAGKERGEKGEGGGKEKDAEWETSRRLA